MLGKFFGSPVVVGNAIKALLVVGTVLGLKTTEASREAIVTAILALVAAYAAITKKVEYNKVTPVAKVATVLEKPVDVVNDLLKKIT